MLSGADAARARRTVWIALSAVAMGASQFFQALDAALAPGAGVRAAWRLTLVVALLGLGLAWFRAGLRALTPVAPEAGDPRPAGRTSADARAG
jgi:predicted oxidoreductase (fatty acid repression mutant protein)